MLSCDLIKTGLHHGYFLRNISTFFGIVICLASQIIVLRGLPKGNCPCVIGELLQPVLKTPVKSHEGLKEGELFAKSYSSGKLFWKVSQI